MALSGKISSQVGEVDNPQSVKNYPISGINHGTTDNTARSPSHSSLLRNKAVKHSYFKRVRQEFSYYFILFFILFSYYFILLK